MNKEIINFRLIGKNINYSFSEEYFKNKFKNLQLNHYSYKNIDLESLNDLKITLSRISNLKGCNVTIPYKELIINYLDDIDDVAKKIGAVNTLKFNDGKIIGFNTDAYGFEQSLNPLLKPNHRKALILGTGGSSKAVAYVLRKKNIDFLKVSRNPTKINQIGYSDLDKSIINDFKIIINCTPIGTFPNSKESPAIPYQYITNQHILFDLIYNPEETQFLKIGKLKGATSRNGMKMLTLQADKSWEIWNA